MKSLKQFLVVLAGLIVFAACQKEYSIDSGLTGGGLATGTLAKDAIGSCQPFLVNGQYVVDSVLKDTNYVYVDLNVASPGIYRIATSVENGFQFKDSGYFSSVGTQSVKLKASGIPKLAILTDFFVIFGKDTCMFTVNVTSTASSNPAAFTLVGSPTTCTNASVQGTYTSGVALNGTNRVDIQVNVTTPGTYNISTTANNGITFRGTGTFSTTGVQSVTLTGTGTPVSAGLTIIPIVVGTTSCGFTLTVAQGSGPASAVFTLVASGTSCSNSTVQGTYVAGTALAVANKVILQVNVTTIGAYNISTIPQNGMTFTGSGSFTTTGVQFVTLQGTGTPAAAQTTTIPLTAGASACAFPVTVTGGGGNTGATAADSAWSFNQGTTFYHGPVDTAYLSDVAGLGKFLSIEGHKYPGSDTLFFIDVLLPGTTVAPGTYSTATSADFYLDLPSTTSLFQSDPTTTGAVMSIVISSYDPATKIVTGTYSGNALNINNVPVPITNGKFKAVVK